MSLPLPPLAHMRTVLRFGMPREEFFAACDELMENYQLRVGSPALDMNLVSIHVQEGGQLLCFLRDEKLVYVEYEGGVFLDEEGAAAPSAALFLSLVPAVLAVRRARSKLALAWLVLVGTLLSLFTVANWSGGLGLRIFVQSLF